MVKHRMTSFTKTIKFGCDSADVHSKGSKYDVYVVICSHVLFEKAEDGLAGRIVRVY